MTETILTWIGMVLLIFCSAFFSSSELAFASSNKMRLKRAADDGNRAAKAAMSIVEDYTRSVSNILFGNNLVNIALTAIATNYVLKAFGAQYELLSTLAITFVVLLFGEVIPKVLATEFADKLVLLVSRPFKYISVLFKPFVGAVTFLVNKMSPWWTPKEAEPTATVEELSELVEAIEGEGVFTETESDLIRSAIEFTDADAHDIMIPRVDMEAWDIEDALEDLLLDDDLLSYSRIPVYRESIDNIIGVLPTKSLMREVIEQAPTDARRPDGRESPDGERTECDVVCDIDIESLLMPVVYAHMTRTISSILAELRQKRLQVAIVVDEFGGTMGMLTMEDIFEEIVGDIFDETDDIEEEVVELQNGSFEVDGGANLLDFFGEIGYDPKDFESDYTTVGGWATEVLDRFPEVGDTFTYGRLEVTVTEAQVMRVEKLHVVLKPEDDEEAEERGDE